MAIVQLKKYLFIGVQEDLQTFFHRAQKKGMIQFVSAKGKAQIEVPDSIRKIVHALKILRALPTAAPLASAQQVDLDHLATKVVNIKGQIEKWLEEKRIVEGEIARIAPLGDFSLEEIRQLEQATNRSIQFFCIKRGKERNLLQEETLFYVNSDYELDYFMGIHSHPQTFSSAIEIHIEKSLSQLEKQKKELIHSISQAREQLKRMTAYLEALSEHLRARINSYHLDAAIHKSEHPLDGTLFAIEAWVPSTKLSSLFSLLKGIAVHGEEIGIRKAERVPTYMENRGHRQIGEDLVHIYDAPSPEDRDPSGWVFWSFILFFSMIISDAGYGLLYLLGALTVRWRFPTLQRAGKRFCNLVIAIAIGCIGWGILSSSYFGIIFPPNHPVNDVSLTSYLTKKKASYHLAARDGEYASWVQQIPSLASVNTPQQFLEQGIVQDGDKTVYKVFAHFSDSVFLELALLIGVIHISLSLLRYASRNYAGIGWVIAIIGGYLYFPSILGSTSLICFTGLLSKEVAYSIGYQFLLGGIALAFLLSLIQNRLGGLKEIGKPIELFADILSYLRLYALGLAGMTLATTFNEMARQIGGILGFCVLIGGHLTNITVGIMGGVIHGLRLNFIEWYHHSFEGGGKLFDPLKLLKIKGE